MQKLDGKLIFSATDLSKFLGCSHLTLLNRRTAHGGPRPPYFDDPGLEVVRQRGTEHEQKYLASLTGEGGRTVADLSSRFGGDPSRERYRSHVAASLDAMRSGVDVIYQGCLFDGIWLGYPDFLLKVDRPSELGGWSYEVADTKLAREAKAGALLQILLYADLLGAIQGVQPETVRLVLGGPGTPQENFRVGHYSAYYRSVRRRFLEWVGTTHELPKAVDPVPHCDLCDWRSVCEAERREVDHLSFVAGISRQQRKSLAGAGVSTLEDLATLDSDHLPKLDEIKPGPLNRIHRQALIQLQGRRSGAPIHELLLPVVENEGLAALPPPSGGDLFFDLEGDPYVFENGIEYLFGLTDTEGRYSGRWSLTQDEERATFEWFMDLVVARRRTHPDLHIYHFAPYEPSALKRLAGRYQTRIDELDDLLRSQVFVDLYRVVRQGLRASVESYSIKKLEVFYGFVRQFDLKEAGRALANFEAWLQLGGGAAGAADLLGAIEGYNRDDCLSTLALRNWLEQLRVELEQKTGAGVPRPAPPKDEVPKEQAEKLKVVRELMAKLMEGVPEDRDVRSPEEQGRWLLAQLLEYHRREKKSAWWQYFKWIGMSEDDRIEDGSAIGGLEYLGVVGKVDRSLIHRYWFPAQDHQLKADSKARDPATRKGAGDIVALDDVACTIDLKRGKTSKVPHPESLIPFDIIPDDELSESLQRLAGAILENGFNGVGSSQASADLLLSDPPRVAGSAALPLIRAGESPLEAAIRLGLSLDRSILPIQGPPGTGKTYTGARMILALLKAGKRIGVTATGHKVIGNLLGEVCKAAEEEGTVVKGIQKAKAHQWCGDGAIPATDDNADVLEALTTGKVQLAAGTAWLWSREDMMGTVDVLFIDEAGQFSLANALAVAPSATSLVLLGDPRQLQQPQQGLHPAGTELSALDHLLRGRETMPSDRGLFLDESWRMHPTICEFTSEVYYERRLRARSDLAEQRVGGSVLPASGLLRLPLAHEGNTSESREEVETVARLVERVLAAGLTWTDRHGTVNPLGIGDILIVAPYNAQVSSIAARLPGGARVGTVDKFQGQEAPIVIYSMTTSSAEDAPRGMSFLYSPNRLNVATSRARCLVILLASQQLYFPDCRTPEQMRLAHGLCRYLELSQSVSLA
jgi:predicted RecB family nuclease